MNDIYVVSKLWTDSLENVIERAMGYEPIGYVHENELHHVKKEMAKANGWPLKEDTPRFQITRLKHIAGEFCAVRF